MVAQPRAGDDLLRKIRKDEFEVFTFHILYFACVAHMIIL